MKKPTIGTSVVLFLFASIISYNTSNARSDVGLSPPEMIQNHGYPSETHYITTEDGYILTHHRLPSKNPAILIVHGLFSSSADFVNSGKNSPAFVLFNAGYDVWIANSRGNTFSQNHTTINPRKDPKNFYNFSWHEIGYFDLPATIDYILALKKADSLYYVGHSQGNTAFFVMGSTRPEYNKKIRAGHMLAPAAIMAHTPGGFLSVSIRTIYETQDLLRGLGFYKVPFLDLVRKFSFRFCSVQNFLCGFFYDLLVNSKNFDKDLVPVILTNAPADVSVNQDVHYGQLMKSGRFQMYDYGPVKNLHVYGSEVPPLYNVTNVVAPVAMYYGASDRIQSPQDIKAFIKQLPNVILDNLIPRKSFNHLDFLWAKDLIELVYKDVIAINKQY